VLVCDDEDTVRVVCARALARGGYDMIATLGRRGIADRARSGSFDAALVDVRLPGLDGPDVDRARCTSATSTCRAWSCRLRVVRRRGALPAPRRGRFRAQAVRPRTAWCARSTARIATTHLKADHGAAAATRSIFASLDPRRSPRRVLDVARSMLNASRVWITLAANGEPVETLHRPRRDRPRAADAGGAAAVAPAGRLREPAVFDARPPPTAEVVTAMGRARQRALVTHRLASRRAAGRACWRRARARRARDYGERDLRRASLPRRQPRWRWRTRACTARSRPRTRELDHAIDRLIAAERVAGVSAARRQPRSRDLQPACAVLASLELAEGAMRPRAASSDDRRADSRARAPAPTRSSICARRCGRCRRGAARRADLIDLRQVIDGATLIASYECGRARASPSPPRPTCRCCAATRRASARCS
jgi:hypothetical protein